MSLSAGVVVAAAVAGVTGVALAAQRHLDRTTVSRRVIFAFLIEIGSSEKTNPPVCTGLQGQEAQKGQNSLIANH